MKTLFILLLMTFASSICIAQRHNIELPSQKYYFDFSTPALTTVLPLRKGMPNDVKKGYQFIDSICQKENRGQIDSLLNHIHSYDTLRYLLKYIYLMKDYNPALFWQYAWYGNLIDTSYMSNPGYVESMIFYRLHTIDARKEKQAQALLAKSSGIFYVTINTINDDTLHISDVGEFFDTRPLKFITAAIVGKIKGYHWPPCPNSTPINNSQRSAMRDTNTCLQFSCDLWSPFVKPSGDNWAIDIAHHRVFGDDGKPAKNYGDIDWSLGKSYIIFFQFSIRYYDGTNDHFIVEPIEDMDPQGGVYPIIAGMVQDSLNFFGMGTSVPLEAFTNRLNNMISELTH